MFYKKGVYRTFFKTFALGLSATILVSCAVVPANAVTPTQSTFFSYADIEDCSTYNVAGSDGDLWPSAWADDGNLYAANGD